MRRVEETSGPWVGTGDRPPSRALCQGSARRSPSPPPCHWTASTAMTRRC